MAVHRTTFLRRLRAAEFESRKSTGNGGERWEVLISSLPESAQRAYAAERTAELREAARTTLAAVSMPEDEGADLGALSAEDYRLIWEHYDRQSATVKERARKALEVVCAFDDLQRQGVPVRLINATLRDQFDTSPPTVWRYRQRVEGHPRPQWEALLAPQYVGGGREAEFSEEAYKWILARFLSTSEPRGNVIIKEARRQAAGQGWVIPSDKTVMRRINAEPAWLTIAGRQGDKVLERSFPTAQRDYDNLRVHERWQSDGRRADVLCRWPDGSIDRPFIVVWMDERSRVVLSVKGYRDPSTELTLSSFRMAVERAQRVPERVKLDNGREYANKAFTGGQARRYRFKVVPGEQVGVLTRMGTVVDWSPPGKGRDKLLESFWNRIAEGCDKSPDFEGAYCGKDAVSKPDNFDPKRHAVPLQDYARKLAQVCDDYNKTEGHRGHGMHYRSPLQAMQDLLPESQAKAPDPVHLRQLLMGSTVLKLDRQDASLRLKTEGYGECRYWSQALMDLPLSQRLNKRFQVYFAPEDPNTPVAVYDLGDKWICDAEPKLRIPVIETGDKPLSTGHAKARGEYVRKARNTVQAIKRTAPDVLPDLRPAELTPLPNANNATHRVEILGREPEAEKPEPAVDWHPDEPGAIVDRSTGRVIRRKTLAPPPVDEPEPAKPLPLKKNLFADWGEHAPQRKTS